MSKIPQTLDELGNSLNLWEKLSTGLCETEAKFPPLQDQFNILEKYEVPVEEEVGFTGNFKKCLRSRHVLRLYIVNIF